MSRVRIPSPAPLEGASGGERVEGRRVAPGPDAGSGTRKLEAGEAGFTPAERGGLGCVTQHPGRKATGSERSGIHSREAKGGSRGCDAAPPGRKNAHVAQSAERVLGKDEVISSILIVGSNLTEGQARSEAGFTPMGGRLPRSEEGVWGMRRSLPQKKEDRKQGCPRRSSTEPNRT